MARSVLEGRPGSPGVGVGRILWLASGSDRPAVVAGRGGAGLATIDPAAEEGRLRAALDAAAAELEQLATETAGRAGAEVGAIFEAQALFARDPGIVDPAVDAIRAGESAEAAIDRVAAEQADVLAGLEDEYFRERAADLRDVGRRVVDHLLGRTRPSLHHRDGTPAIVAVDDLEPSLVAALRPELVAGMAFAGGAPTGHAAIVARALGIPLVLGLGSDLVAGFDGLDAAVDGTEGRLIVEPAPDELAVLARRGEAAGLAAVGRPGPAGRNGTEAGEAAHAWTPPGDDGTRAIGPAAVEANVGSLAEAELAARVGADGIGLVRTELLFLGRTTAPGLAEQRGLYGRIAAAMAGRPVVFRTLDVGGDKPAGFEPGEPEPNPALGVRGIRLGLRRESLFGDQLRALLEASPADTLRILLPMVATLDEVRAARAAIERAREASVAAGATVASDVRVGVMIEVPSAALLADVLAPEVDFFSIGTNDLVQYTLAADRTNAQLADLASPLQPAVLRLVGGVCRAAAAHGRPVAVCGEAAADPAAGALLVGLGVTELSVTPRAVAPTRAMLAGLDVDAARAAANATLGAATVGEVREIAEGLLG